MTAVPHPQPHPQTGVPVTPATRRWPWPPAIGASVGLHVGAAGMALLAPGAAWWSLGAVALNHAALTAAGLWPRSTWLGPNLRRLPAASAARGELAITIDDGPDAEVTPAVLDLLAAHGAHGENGVRATFFCIAAHARAHPALLRRMVAAGHSVQNHSSRHPHHFSLMGPRAMAREVGDAQAVLADITGVLPHCFRAPAGLRNPLLDPVLHRLGLHLVSWTRRGFDTREANPAVVLRRLVGNTTGAPSTAGGAATAGAVNGHDSKLTGGDILLLHDHNARRTAAGRPVLLDVLPALLQACTAQGLIPVTLSHAVAPRHAPQDAPTHAPHQHKPQQDHQQAAA